MNSARFGSWVSESWNASWVSTASSAFQRVTSWIGDHEAPDAGSAIRLAMSSSTGQPAPIPIRNSESRLDACSRRPVGEIQDRGRVGLRDELAEVLRGEAAGRIAEERGGGLAGEADGPSAPRTIEADAVSRTRATAAARARRIAGAGPSGEPAARRQSR